MMRREGVLDLPIDHYKILGKKKVENHLPEILE